ncbi:MAG: BCCT family transporter [Blautia marasmi]
MFLPPFFLFLVCIIINIADSDLFTKIVNTLNSFIVDQFGWLIILLPVLIFFVCIAIYFSGFGKVKIGKAGAKPKMSLLSWFSINICTTIACGIIFWSAAEPIQHLLHPRTVSISKPCHRMPPNLPCRRSILTGPYFHTPFTRFRLSCSPLAITTRRSHFHWQL